MWLATRIPAASVAEVARAVVIVRRRVVVANLIVAVRHVVASSPRIKPTAGVVSIERLLTRLPDVVTVKINAQRVQTGSGRGQERIGKRSEIAEAPNDVSQCSQVAGESRQALGIRNGPKQTRIDGRRDRRRDVRLVLQLAQTVADTIQRANVHRSSVRGDILGGIVLNVWKIELDVLQRLAIRTQTYSDSLQSFGQLNPLAFLGHTIQADRHATIEQSLPVKHRNRLNRLDLNVKAKCQEVSKEELKNLSYRMIVFNDCEAPRVALFVERNLQRHDLSRKLKDFLQLLRIDLIIQLEK